jgi:hypothetical protein
MAGSQKVVTDGGDQENRLTDSAENEEFLTLAVSNK